jgi:FkbM family methyltransferase
MMSTLLKRQGHVSFLQIGGNDGVRADPIHPFVSRHSERIRGVVVEPIGDYFAALCRNYAPYPRIKPVNVAIHNTEREMTMYRVSGKAKGLKGWTRGLATFDASRHATGKAHSEHMVEERVKCVPIGSLIAEHGMPDVLQIDTEGYDEHIVNDLDLSNAPKVIRWEYVAMTEANFRAKLAELNAQGYQVMIEPHDVTAYKPEIVIDDRVKRNR